MTPKRFSVRGEFDWSFRLRYAHAQSNMRIGRTFEHGGWLLELLIESRMRSRLPYRRPQMRIK